MNLKTNYLLALTLLCTFTLFACNENKHDGRYITYKVVSNDEYFGWINDLNDSLNNSMKSRLEGTHYDLAIKDKYASLTISEKNKTILLPKVPDSLGNYFQYDSETTDTKTKMTLTKNKEGELVYIVDFEVRMGSPSVYPAQLGGILYNLNFNKGRAICYLTPLK